MFTPLVLMSAALIGILGSVYVTRRYQASRSVKENEHQRTLIYTQDTLPRDALSTILLSEREGVRTAIHYAWNGKEGTLGVYVTPQGIRVGTLSDWYQSNRAERRHGIF